ncbi:hypothetical protein GGS23DRAFT_617429 [Durotheca rogersii]|uniref:uncharacterized protein n=1 Tax=Durotheca rogersii TaxID=419775 RepID=UPI0022209558|nr:uncharacterized protein GGS23DRAFT_617429 [Durotheca rogersii]KAI5866327.1 hypothetical protein GGS23DRAFT_617429 [Durotheca rogersii]
MALPAVVWLASAAILSLVTFLALRPAQRAAVLGRLGLGGAARAAARRPSTPSLEKQPPPSKPLASSSSDLAATFPPRQRAELQQLAAALPEAQRRALGDVAAFDEAAFARALLGLAEDYRAPAAAAKYSCSGLAVREIRALGDFPDYAALSGVPPPAPYPEFDIDRALPRPYRPFRWPYHQTMSLTKLEPDWWLELESTYRTRIAQRKALYAEHGSSVLGALPGSELACKELMEMALQFLCARYPHYFSLSADARGRTVFENRILDVRTVVSRGSAAEAEEEEDGDVVDPLLVLLEHVPEDFGIVLRDPDSGYYYLRAGVICSALGWNVGTKIGLRLDQIHEPIPDYKEKMQFSMDRYFSKMPTSKPIQRGSWGLEVDQPLYMPPGDPHEALRGSQDPGLGLERVHLRVDWQTLRRLPLSGAVVFNFKALFTPLAELRDEPYVPALVLRVLAAGNPRIMRYKNTWHVEHVAVPALRQFAREQRDRGLVATATAAAADGAPSEDPDAEEEGEGAWSPRTLDESPWFPGWQEKWHRQQGF